MERRISEINRFTVGWTAYFADRHARQSACSGKGPWRIAGSLPLQRALPNAYWSGHGLRTFTETYHRLRDAERTAGCGPACPVVWEGRG